MSKPETISFYEFFQRFPDEEAARLFFEGNRWGNDIRCAHCDSREVSECKDHKPMPYRCKTCRKHFSVRTRMVLAESRLPLHRWLMAIYMMTTARKGIPSTQMARELGITQKTAWFLSQRIRETWLATRDSGMGPTIEVDETYFGGNERDKHPRKRLNAGRGSVGKQPVIGIMERGGNVVAGPIPSTDGHTLKNVIRHYVTPGSTVYTDSHAGYRGMTGYNHGVGEYVRKQAHTNGIESFWALLKRGYYGIYHHMSVKHLHRYVNEFSFRHNTAKNGTIQFIEITVARMCHNPLIYKDLIDGQKAY